jgi:hypothetical protein
MELVEVQSVDGGERRNWRVKGTKGTIYLWPLEGCIVVHEHAEFAARGTPTPSGRAIVQTCGA